MKTSYKEIHKCKNCEYETFIWVEVWGDYDPPENKQELQNCPFCTQFKKLFNVEYNDAGKDLFQAGIEEGKRQAISNMTTTTIDYSR